MSREGEQVDTPPEGSFFTFVDDKRYPPDLWMWNGTGWTQNLKECVRYHTGEELNDAWIALSAQDIPSAQPAMIEQVPVQLTDGPHAGMWVLQVKVYFMEKQ